MSLLSESGLDLGVQLLRKRTAAGGPPAPSGYAAAVLADSPYAHWRLGEAEGASEAVDASGNNRNGFYLGNPVLGALGALPSEPSRTSMSLDGADDWVNTPVLGNISIRTFEIWAYIPSGLTGAREIIDLDNYLEFSPTYGGCWIYANCGTGLIHAGIYGGDGGGGPNLDMTQAFTPNDWNYIVLVDDVPNNLGRLYFNGAQVATAARVAGSLNVDATASVRMGRTQSASNKFIGRLQEPAVYQTALSAGRIAAHYAAR